MVTHKIHSTTVSTSENNAKISLLEKFYAFADSQKSSAMVWWLCSLLIIGTIFLPLTFLLVYSLGGPTIPFLFLSMISFFACVVTNMGGMGIRTTLATFFFSIVIHFIMIAITLVGIL